MNNLDKKMLRAISGAGLIDTWTQGYKQKLEGDRIQKEYQMDIDSRVEIPKVNMPQDIKNVGLEFTKGCVVGAALGAAAGPSGVLTRCVVTGSLMGVLI